MMLCACSAATDICLWCVTKKTQSESLPLMHYEYIKMISAIHQRLMTLDECEAKWKSYVQQKLQDLLPVNIKPAKNARMS